MRDWLHRHTNAIAYIILVLATSAAVGWYSDHTADERAKLQRETCVRATVLADNQIKVIGSLIALLEIEQSEAEINGQGEHVIDQLAQLRERLDTIPEFDCR